MHTTKEVFSVRDTDRVLTNQDQGQNLYPEGAVTRKTQNRLTGNGQAGQGDEKDEGSHGET